MNEARREITELIIEVARSHGDTYDRALKVWEYSSDHSPGEDWIYHPLWLLWGVLTDWAEAKPEETEEAEATIRQAAQAFLPIADDDDALRLYFDRWLYVERGGFYARPEPPPKNPPFSRRG